MINEKDIKSAWENVVLKNLPPDEEVRPEVLRSWIRCREIELDPYSDNAPPKLTKGRLQDLLRRNKDLVELSKLVMQMVEVSVRDTGFLITLADRRGYVLLVRGDKEIQTMAEENFYKPGCLRSVEHAGTNAIGLCLEEGRPIQVTGAEHYKLHHHPWTCSSAPIRDTRGKILGAITLSGHSVGMHQHTLALVTAAAETIESQLRERELIDEKMQLNSMLTLIYNSISDGIIATGKELEITHINSIAAKMLDLDIDAVIGKKLEEVVRSGDPLIQSLKDRKYFTGIETGFICQGSPRNYICSIDPIRNSSGHVLGSIITITEKHQMIKIAERLGGNYAKYLFTDIKGNEPAFRRQMEMAKIAAKTNSRILLLGESGTGKELFAQAIHNHSNRSKGPFVALSCAAIPRDLIESELFGYRGGAFTGARRDGQVGKFELADKGTLFLDEVDGLPLDLQTKLLRVLQESEIMRLGDTRTIPVDVRVIAASNADLMSEVDHHNFREDLYYRINVVEITILPLRERIEDLDILIDHIMERQCQEMGFKKSRISDEVLEILKGYHWPGNVRELENCLERALLLSQGDTIRKVHLPEKSLRKTTETVYDSMPLHQGYRKMIESAIERCGGNISMAARELQIARSTLYRKMKEFGLSE
ncbi:MAG: sigma-54-dependent Fis family transcriptional regulator [Deltaproteobacteria bacterium]|nr:sigma-54-dependent Fis family transcriptional regulator [Deltaproteobacteria bacterium]